MIFQFPNLDTLRLCMTSGLIPDATQNAPLQSKHDDDGSVWVKATVRLSKKSFVDMQSLGVRFAKTSDQSWDQQHSCWPQLFKLKSMPEQELTAKTPVLFLLSDASTLPEIVNEILRQGNDRQSFRILEQQGQTLILLRVTDVPYYSLLRASDALQATSSAEQRTPSLNPQVFVERAPRVWIQFGYQHELLELIQPAPGQWILMESPQSWRTIAESPFTDIYQALELKLPQQRIDYQDAAPTEKIETTVKLAQGQTAEPAQMWVLKERAFEQIEQLVSHSDNRLLDRLAFAVAESDSTIIVRVRPSKQKSPVLVFDGIGFYSYLRIPNLFMPVGHRLHPPLRRDVVTDLLVPSSAQITWLYPGEAGNFTPESIPDSAFMPMSDWVDYVLDRDHQSLDTWSHSFRFEFESFVCDRDQKPSPAQKPPKRPKPEPKPTRQPAAQPSEEIVEAEIVSSDPSELAQLSTPPTPVARAPQTPNELQLRLRELEQEFEALDDPPDSRRRTQLWQAMARINGGLKRRSDATVSWANALWEKTETAMVDEWFRSEQQNSGVESCTPARVVEFLNDPQTGPSETSLIAAAIVHAATMDSPPVEVTSHLEEITQFLLAKESTLPVRVVWMAWLALCKLADQDVLGLARARDRILERLLQNGLTPEYDVPTFLRIRSVRDRDRHRVLGQQIIDLEQLVRRWIVEPVAGLDPQTRAYARLTMAFGLARIGEDATAKRWMDQIVDELAGKDHVHFLLGQCYAYRIGQALAGEQHEGSFSQEILESNGRLDRMDRYKMDRLRAQSRILEPHERINAFSRWHERYADPLEQRLAQVAQLIDRSELHAALEGLLEEHKQPSEAQTRILAHSLELSTRLGADFASQIVDRVVGVLPNCASSIDKALLLQKAIYVSAHFGRIDAVQTLVASFTESLPQIVASYLQLKVQHNPENKDKVETVELLFTDSFQGLRKLGMREEIGRIYGNVAELIKRYEPQGREQRKTSNTKLDVDAARPLRLLLCVAGGWYYFGMTDQANEVADQVRETLFRGDLSPMEQRDLACAYAQAVAYAPAEEAFERIAQMFQANNDEKNLSNVRDNMTTVSHFSISQLDVVETTVLAMVSDTFSLNQEGRRWLDEDEFLVRRRIHEDVRQAMTYA